MPSPPPARWRDARTCRHSLGGAGHRAAAYRARSKCECRTCRPSPARVARATLRLMPIDNRDSGRLGKAVEHLVAATCILTSGLELNASTSFVDDEGVDLVFA